MGGLPYDPNTNRVQCPICHQWVQTYRCGEPFDLIGVGRQECPAEICPVCNVSYRSSSLSAKSLHLSLQPQALSQAVVAMDYWIYENWTAEQKAVIHRSNCSFCNAGRGVHPGSTDRNGQRNGPIFNPISGDPGSRGETGRPVRRCGHSKP